MQCSRCHAENPEGYAFCGSCGAPMGTQSARAPQRVFFFGRPVPMVIALTLAVCALCGLATCLFASAVPRERSTDNIAVQAPRAPTALRAAAARSTATVYRVGDLVSSGNWEYTVTDVQKVKSLATSYKSTLTPKGLFVLAYLTLKNIGTRNFTINTWDFTLRDANGINYDSSRDVSYSSLKTDRQLVDLGEQTIPGLAFDSVLVFDINPNATGLKLYLEQAKVTVDLGQ